MLETPRKFLSGHNGNFLLFFTLSFLLQIGPQYSMPSKHTLQLQFGNPW